MDAVVKEVPDGLSDKEVHQELLRLRNKAVPVALARKAFTGGRGRCSRRWRGQWTCRRTPAGGRDLYTVERWRCCTVHGRASGYIAQICIQSGCTRESAHIVDLNLHFHSNFAICVVCAPHLFKRPNLRDRPKKKATTTGALEELLNV